MAYDVEDKKERQQRLQKAIVLQELSDPRTGRPYFQPKTGRNPEGRGLETSVNIGTHLYEQA